MLADLVRRAFVVADSPAARRLAAELEGVTAIASLSEIVAGGRGRPPDADVTLFKAMGIGLADLAVAVAASSAPRRRGRPPLSRTRS